ncbi:hypothetical protein KIPB_012570, partial [Kipferlia bialata]
GASSLAQALTSVPNLKELIMADNEIRDAGAAALARALPHLPRLTMLDISCGCSVSLTMDEGIEAIVATSSMPERQTLLDPLLEAHGMEVTPETDRVTETSKLRAENASLTSELERTVQLLASSETSLSQAQEYIARLEQQRDKTRLHCSEWKEKAQRLSAMQTERDTYRDRLASAEEGFRSFTPSATVSARSFLSSLTAMDTSDVSSTLEQLNAYAPAAKGLTKLAGPLARFLRKHNPSLLSHENVVPLVSIFAPLHFECTKCLQALDVISIDSEVATAKLKGWLEVVEAVEGLVPVFPPADIASLSLDDKQLVCAAVEFNQVVMQVYSAAEALLPHCEALSATVSALSGIRPVAVSKATALRAKVQHMAQQLQCRVEAEADMRGIMAKVTDLPVVSKERQKQVAKGLARIDVELDWCDSSKERDTYLAKREALLAEQ